MASYNVQLRHISDGIPTDIFPNSKAKLISVLNTNEAVPDYVSNLQSLVDSLKLMAFEDGNNVVYFDPDDHIGETTISSTSVASLSLEEESSTSLPINDSIISEYSTWSSKKIADLFTKLGLKFDDNGNIIS